MKSNYLVEIESFQELQLIKKIIDCLYPLKQIEKLDLFNQIKPLSKYILDRLGILELNQNISLNIKNGLLTLASPSSMTKVTIEKCVKINDYVFKGFKNLRSVDIKDGLVVIGKGAFYNCKLINHISLPRSIKEIDDEALYNLSSLKRIELLGKNMKLKLPLLRGASSLNSIKLSVNVFQNNGKFITLGELFGTEEYNDSSAINQISNNTSVMYYIPNQLNEVIIEGDEKESYIPPYAFSNISSLNNVMLPNNLKSISNGMFLGCSSIENIIIPNTVKEIGYEAFKDCQSLSKIEIPDGVEEIGAFAFRNCVNLKEIEIPSSVKKIGYHAFDLDVKIILKANDIPSGFENEWCLNLSNVICSNM